MYPINIGGLVMLFSKLELEILNLLWQSDEPLTRAEIIEKADDKDWKVSTIHLLLSNLLSKNLIKVEGVKPAGRTYARAFKAIPKEEFAIMQFKYNFPDGSLNKKQFKSVFSALINTNDVDISTIEELKKLLDEKQKELSK